MAITNAPDVLGTTGEEAAQGEQIGQAFHHSLLALYLSLAGSYYIISLQVGQTGSQLDYWKVRAIITLVMGDQPKLATVFYASRRIKGECHVS